jgi:hypothetical protein
LVKLHFATLAQARVPPRRVRIRFPPRYCARRLSKPPSPLPFLADLRQA